VDAEVTERKNWVIGLERKIGLDLHTYFDFLLNERQNDEEIKNTSFS
jgi:hypothetical protein